MPPNFLSAKYMPISDLGGSQLGCRRLTTVKTSHLDEYVCLIDLTVCVLLGWKNILLLIDCGMREGESFSVPIYLSHRCYHKEGCACFFENLSAFSPVRDLLRMMEKLTKLSQALRKE